jgi:predicted amidohydrolase YtcJ
LDTVYGVTAPFSGTSDAIVLSGCRVHRTADDLDPAPAIAIADGAVVAVGSLQDARAAVPRGTREVDLGGRTVTPAFIDSHTHFHRSAVLRQLYLDFEALAPASIADVVAHVRERASELPNGAWIQGDSLSMAALREQRLPDRRELDAAAPDQPVLLRGIGKHVVAANSAALNAAGIDRDTSDPPGGRIERDEAGEPTGILHERAKLRLDTSAEDTVVPGATPEERLAAVRATVPILHREGIATIHEMVRLPEEAADLAAVHAAGDLGVRVRLWYRIHETPLRLEWLTSLGIRTGRGDDRFRVLGTKISVDGWCIFGNAAVYEPYTGRSDGTGIMRIDPPELSALVCRSAEAGLAVAVHAVGARAVDAALDAFEALPRTSAGVPNRVEHAHLDLDAGRLDRMRSLGVVWSAQPGFLPAYRRDWEQVLEADRVERLMPLRSGSDRGIPLILNSDTPSGPLGPLRAISAAVTRDAGGRTIGAHEAIPIRAAWRAHSTTAAEVSGDTALGVLAPGRRADLIVVDRDPFAPDADVAAVARDGVAATMIEGSWVHER